MAKSSETTAAPVEARYYEAFCGVALAVIFLVKAPDGVLTALLFCLVGVWGILSRLRTAPILLLMIVGVIEFGRLYGWGNLGRRAILARTMVRAEDVLFCVSVLAYIVGHYRLQSLVLNVLPLDPRRRTGPPRWQLWPPKMSSGIQPTLRSGSLVTMREIGALVLGLPLAALAAQVVWAVLSPRRELFGMPVNVSRMALAAWSLAPVVLLAAAILGVWRRRHQSPQAHALYLQDVLWHQTRREQRRIQRWCVWQRLRRKDEA